MTAARAVVFDSGALIAIERGSRRMQALLEKILNVGGVDILVPAGVVAQVWRDGVRQARLARLLRAPQTRVVDLTDARARVAGVLLGRTDCDDVVDASVVVCARERGGDVRVLTSDAGDLERLDPALMLILVGGCSRR